MTLGLMMTILIWKQNGTKIKNCSVKDTVKGMKSQITRLQIWKVGLVSKIDKEFLKSIIRKQIFQF